MSSIPVSEGYAEAARALRHVHEQEIAIETAKLIAIVAMCDRYQVTETVIVEGCEETMVYGAEGNPELADFFSLEIAALLGITDKQAGALISETLNLRHRHPLLWDAVMAGRVRSWPARQVTWKTRHLSLEKCLQLDRQLAAALAHQPVRRALGTVERLVIAADPELAAKRAKKAARLRDVKLYDITDGQTDVWARLDPGDGIALDEAVARIAAAIPDSEGDQGQRRAKALGWLARNANGETVPDYLPLGEEEAFDRLEAAAAQQGLGGGRRLRGGRSAELVIHLTGTVTGCNCEQTTADGQQAGADATQAGAGIELSPVARIDRYGAILTEQLAGILAGCRVRVNPILDVNDVVPVDGYQIPDRMRRIQQARNPYCVFPFSGIPSRNCDLDHTAPYDPDAPAGAGQTSLANLGPLARKPHRAKTHGGWLLEQPEPGIYHWTSPAGFQYTVTPHGTIAHPHPADLTAEQALEQAA